MSEKVIQYMPFINHIQILTSKISIFFSFVGLMVNYIDLLMQFVYSLQLIFFLYVVTVVI